jgi:carbonic anhydrase/acetyltransferase-like protein (isoleucine patch superfamily)
MGIESYQGRTPKLGNAVFVHASATIIGDVEIDDQVSIWPGVVIRADVNRIRIGARSNVQDGTILHVTHQSKHNPAGAPLIIGRDVTIGHAVILHGCQIHDECLIGMGSLVMDHAVIEPRVLLGAGSLVPEGRVLSSGWLYLGRPVRQVRRLSEEELEFFAYQATNYARLAEEYRQSQSQ